MLTEQKKLFVDEYLKLKCKNATQAAINAGYSEKTAYSQANRLLKDVEVQSLLKEKKTQIEQELRERFLFEAQQAVAVICDIMTKSSDKNRLSAAKDILDRAGFKGIDEIKFNGNIESSGADKLAAILAQLEGKKGQ